MIDGATARAQGLWLGAESGIFQFHSSLVAQYFKRLSSLLECQISTRTPTSSCGMAASPPAMDRRTFVFLILTLSVCANTALCFLGSLGIPYVKRLTKISFQISLVSAMLAFLYRIAYSLKLEAYNFAALKKCIAPIMDSNGFQYTVYCLIFLPGRPVVSVAFPIAVCSAYQVLTIVNKHFSHLEVYQRAGGSRLFAYTEKNMHRAMMMCATMENSLLPVVLAELLTPARSVSKVMMLVNLLRSRYKCSDNTVFRIKYTYYNTGYYHQQFWNMIDEKTAPIVARLGPVKGAVGALKRWFTGGTAGGPKDKPQ